jgi:hypothetical protein
MDMITDAAQVARHEANRAIQAAGSRTPSQAAHGEYLTFRLGAEEYGIDILRVQEIRSYEQPTRIANAPAFKDAKEGLGIAFHILNQFDIPPGSVRTAATGSAGGGVAGYEVTEWTSTADLKNGIYQITTYENQDIRQVSLSDVDLDAKEVRFIPLDQPQGVTDLSR